VNPSHHAPIGVLHTTRAGGVVTVNPRLVAILGCASGADVAALDFARDVYLYAEEREALLARCEASPDPQAAEVQWNRQDGALIWVEVTTRAVRDAGGAVRYFESFVQDITARKSAELRLREAERKSLARELHDSLGQILTALKLDLAALAQRLPATSRGARARVRAATTLVDTAMEVTQRVVSELRPGILDDLGLEAAVQWAAAEFERRSEIPCVVAVDGVGALDDALSTTIFRVLQESLTNVARHSGASRVTIQLTADARDIALTVRDDGRGIDATEATRGHHLGLRGIRERVSAWGGAAEVFGGPDQGTTVRVRIPLRAAGVEERAS